MFALQSVEKPAMTKSAIDLAREALHRGHVALRNHEISDLAAVERAFSEISQALTALAALTTEPSPVPPDRERPTLEPLTRVSFNPSEAGFTLVTDEETERELAEIRAGSKPVAAFIRQPAPAEVPPGIAGLIADIRAKGGLISCPDMLDFLNIVERRFALPAVGDWRPIEKAKLSKHDREQVEKEIKRAEDGWEIWLEEAGQASAEEDRETERTMMAISGAFNDLSNALTNIIRSADGLPPLRPVLPAPPIPEEPSR